MKTLHLTNGHHLCFCGPADYVLVDDDLVTIVIEDYLRDFDGVPSRHVKWFEYRRDGKLSLEWC
jgi:hypothetical protein